MVGRSRNERNRRERASDTDGSNNEILLYSTKLAEIVVTVTIRIRLGSRKEAKSPPNLFPPLSLRFDYHTFCSASFRSSRSSYGRLSPLSLRKERPWPRSCPLGPNQTATRRGPHWEKHSTRDAEMHKDRTKKDQNSALDLHVLLGISVSWPVQSRY